MKTITEMHAIGEIMRRAEAAKRAADERAKASWRRRHWPERAGKAIALLATALVIGLVALALWVEITAIRATID
jgi:hypothetical protein